MDSRKVLYNKIGDDETYTFEYSVEPIVKYIKQYRDKQYFVCYRDLVVWAPFDKKDSAFVKMIGEIPLVTVVFSHIDNGQDFFEYEPESWDIIVSNPPFKNKRKFFERALDLGKPFALIMTLTIFNDKYPIWSFYEREMQVQLLKFDKRMEFEQKGEVKRKITFQSGYICYNFLPRDFILEVLNKPKK